MCSKKMNPKFGFWNRCPNTVQTWCVIFSIKTKSLFFVDPCYYALHDVAGGLRSVRHKETEQKICFIQFKMKQKHEFLNTPCRTTAWQLLFANIANIYRQTFANMIYQHADASVKLLVLVVCADKVVT